MEELEKEVLDDFRNRLLKLNEEIIKVEEKSKKKGDKFNIFSILGIQRKEVETHSFLLYDLINPNGSHGQEDLYLKIFLKEILKEKDDFKIDNLLDNAKNVKVDRETFISGKGIKNGFIDFTIEIDKYYIAIEMKIDSKENGNQLDNYKTFLDSIPNKEKRLYYLTLFGDEADKSKIEADKKDGYIRISFLEHISKFIEKSIEKSKNLPLIRESLIQYQTTIKNITNQSTKDIQMEVIKIINNPQMARTANEFSKNLAYAWAKREVLFWEKLAEKLENYLEDEKEWNLKQLIFFKYESEDFDTEENILDWIVGKDSNRCEKFYIEKDGFSFNIISEKNDNFYYSITSDNKKINLTEINKELEFEKEKGILIWQSTKIKNGLNFSKDYANPTYDVFDGEKLDEIVDKIYEEIVYYMDIIIKSKLV